MAASPLTQRLLQLNLEITYLLTGENYGPIRKELGDHVTLGSSFHSSGGERNDQKILELARKIIQLLTNGKDLYKDQHPCISLESRPGESRPPKPLRAAKDPSVTLQSQTAVCLSPEEPDTVSVEIVPCEEKETSPAMDTSKPKDLPTEYIQLKEEEPLRHPGLSTPGHHIQSVPTWVKKEEEHPSGEEHLLPQISTARHHIQPVPTPDKGKAHLSDEEPLPPPSTSTHHIESTPSHIKEEPRSLGNAHVLHPHASSPVHHTQALATPSGEESELIPHIEVTLPENETSQPSTGVTEEMEEEPLPHHSALGGQQTSEPGQKSYFCAECGKRFRYNTWFLAHQKSHIVTPAFCSECNRHFSNTEALKRHLRAHSSPKAKCPECGKLFPTKTDLRNHQLIHAKSYRCSECAITFSSHLNFLKHQKLHQGETVYQCGQCEKCFSNPERLQRHQRVHTGERLFSCTECQQTFLDRCDLVKHMRIHTGERPFICLQCGSSFYNSSNFLRHWRAHSKNKP